MDQLVVDDLWKSYDSQRWVLEGIDLAVPRGAFALITGRSGSGKTTLFNLLGLLDVPTRGTIRLAGDDVTALDEEARARIRLSRIGFVFQDHNLIDDLTVLENVQLPRELAGDRDGAEPARQLLDEFGIGDLADHYPSEVSGGEAQRCAIARSLANDPDLILADEPTGNLDAGNVDVVLDALGRVNDAFGATVLVVTHDPLVMDQVDTGWHLEDGRLKPV